MTQRLFENLPNFYYSNTLCKDITRRAKFIDDKERPSFLLLEYDLEHSLRADQVSEYYYNNSELDWLIYMTNDIIDPYYEWHLNDLDFEEMLIHKYGSVANAMKKVKFYINNWYDNQTEIEASFYDNNLPLNWKKYYVPSVWKSSKSVITNKKKVESAVYTNSPITYKRKEIDVIMNTNRILELTVHSNNSTKGLVVGELVDFLDDNGSSVSVGAGEVLVANSTIIRVMNVSGNTSANNTNRKIVVGESSNANITISNSAIAVKTLVVNSVVTTTKFENIPLDEEVFWSPVTCFDYENIQNEKRKTLHIAASGSKDIIVQKFFERLQENMDPISRISTMDENL